MSMKFLFDGQMTHALTSYLEDIKDTQPFTTEEEHELGRRSQQGDIDARNQLVEANQRFVVECVLKFNSKTVPAEELVSAGRLGLVIAATRYNPTFEGRFTTYAVHYIMEYIRQAIAECCGIVRVPKDVLKVSRLKSPSLNDELDYEKLLDWKPNMVFNPIYLPLDERFDEDDADSRQWGEVIASGADEEALAYVLRESDADLRAFLSNYYNPMEVKLLLDYAHKLLDGYTIADLAHDYRMPKKCVKQYVAQLIEKAKVLQLRDIYHKRAA